MLRSRLLEILDPCPNTTMDDLGSITKTCVLYSLNPLSVSAFFERKASFPCTAVFCIFLNCLFSLCFCFCTNERERDSHACGSLFPYVIASLIRYPHSLALRAVFYFPCEYPGCYYPLLLLSERASCVFLASFALCLFPLALFNFCSFR